LENTSYGIQKTEQEFIIWKYNKKGKWVPLAEYNYKFNIAKIYQSILRRKKIDLIIDLLIYFMGNNYIDMKRNIIYNILNKENENNLIIFCPVKDKRRFHDIIHFPIIAANKFSNILIEKQDEEDKINIYEFSNKINHSKKSITLRTSYFDSFNSL
jgi:hypothetical protein